MSVELMIRANAQFKLATSFTEDVLAETKKMQQFKRTEDAEVNVVEAHNLLMLIMHKH